MTQTFSEYSHPFSIRQTIANMPILALLVLSVLILVDFIFRFLLSLRVLGFTRYASD